MTYTYTTLHISIVFLIFCLKQFKRRVQHNPLFKIALLPCRTSLSLSIAPLTRTTQFPHEQQHSPTIIPPVTPLLLPHYSLFNPKKKLLSRLPYSTHTHTAPHPRTAFN